MLNKQVMFSQAIRGLFEIPVECSVATIAMYEAPVFPEEAASIAHAIAPRRREFAAGRACARDALVQLGLPRVSIPMGHRRQPIWPTGFIGSISHCPELCCAVATSANEAASIGIDVDLAELLPSRLTGIICSDREVARLPKTSSPISDLWTKIIFCTKEAFFKCYYPITEKFIDFSEVDIDITVLSPQSGTFTAEFSGQEGYFFSHRATQDYKFSGRWQLIEKVILASAWATALR